MEEIDRKDNKQSQNKFVAFLKRVFVHNIGWKLLALGTAAVIWFLAAGLW